ncbi:MAG: LacI family transcriptional regulator [Clostridiales bacterium]|nr:LacI family transcriptional regulator [Clostridiales bacterium]
MATIKDVALRAGVSVATVSRVLNNAETVGESYRTAVQAAIEELNFQPNIAARSLKKRPYRTIGVIMPDFSTPFYEKIIKRIENKFRSGSDLVLFVNAYDDPRIEKKGIDFMMEHQADVILISSTGQNEQQLAKVQSAGVGVIFVDRRPGEPLFPAVYMDKKSGMRKALEHLEKMGHSRIAVVTGPRQLASNYDRYVGAMDYLYEKARDPGAIPFYYGSFSEHYGYEIAGQILNEQNPPTAIVAGSAVIAAGIMGYCREKGVKIPQDLSLISFGDFSHGRLIEPRLTYITDENEQIGALLARRITDYFAGKLTNTVDMAQPRLVIHGSVCQRKGEAE